MQRVKKIGYVVALVFAASAMSGISAAAPPQPSDTPQPQESPPPSSDMPQHKDMPQPKDEAQPNDQTNKDQSKDQTNDQTKDQKAGGSEVMAEKMSTTATVVKVNTGKRQLILKDDQGKQFEVDVPSSVTGIEKLKKGDKLAIDYYSSVALSLMPKGSEASSGMSTSHEKVAGPLPGGVMAKTVRSTVEVMDIDKSGNKVTVKLPSGDVDTIDVKDSAMQADLDKIKKGDKIKVSYTEAVAVAVTPQGKTPT